MIEYSSFIITCIYYGALFFSCSSSEEELSPPQPTNINTPITKAIKLNFYFYSFNPSLFYFIFKSVLFYLNHSFQASILLFGIFIIYFLTFVIRIFYFKSRPKKVKYSNFIEKIDASSFPSVHAARTTFILLLLLVYFVRSFFLAGGLIFVAFLACYSRIYLMKHDKVDVFGGIVLGIVSFVPFLINALSTTQ